MHYKINGFQINMGNRRPVLSQGVLNFDVRGVGFPDSYVYSPEHAAYRTGRIQFVSTTPNTLEINYGDGTIQTYVFEQKTSTDYRLYIGDINYNFSSLGIKVPYYEYTDGNSGKRNVSMKFSDPNGITSISSNLLSMYGTYPHLDMLRSLKTFSIAYTRYITTFPMSIANTTITTLALTSIGTALTNGIPMEILNIPITSLILSGSVTLTDIHSSNFNRINLLKNTLTSIGLSSCGIVDLPNEFVELTNMTSLTMNTNKFTTIPTLLNSMTWLIDLNIGGGHGVNSILTDWCDLSGLNVLRTLTIAITPKFTTEMPTWFGSLVALRSFSVHGNYQTQQRADAFIDSFYATITANAAITGSNSLPLRGMSVLYSSAGSNAYASTSSKPSGVYQAPTGYVQGSSNGTPATQQEKIWVMVNQYGHVWSMTYANPPLY